ncbi:radical SAM protein [Schlesneria sp. DSM 10557]|uniref:radical SAM protein n=1 Tax=Schlesneria sp. DSM 10557 TaxID=3044399 RepID=UPI00359F392B
MFSLPISDAEVVATRPTKNRLDPWKPYLTLIEPERSSQGRIEDVLTIFLTNRECPFRCTMCDLWKNTLDERVPLGAIPAQIRHACTPQSAAKHVKLYNAGSFFDPQAIPREDHAEIASLVCSFETVILENHPRLINHRCLEFHDQVQTGLEIALGLETVHPAALASLNKRMTVEDFDDAAQFLVKNGIAVRAFVLLKPPGMDEEQGMEWALRSVQHAVEQGARCVSIIPTRGGNGMMERLQATGDYSPPVIHSMERTLERGLDYASRQSVKPRIFMDTWDSARFFECPECGPARAKRICEMNLTQQIPPTVTCAKCHS